MIQSVKKLIEKAKLKNNTGKIETLENIERMEEMLQITFPHPLKEIYLSLPIVNVMTAYNEAIEKSDWKYYSMSWMDCENIISEMTETETGTEMGQKGFLAIGMDVLGGGDYFYINLKDKELPLYQCFHDDMSLERMASSLDEVFEKASVE